MEYYLPRPGHQIIKDFPVEINQVICSYLITDIDLLNFALTCKCANVAAFEDDSVLRQRFRSEFDQPTGPDTAEFDWKELDLKRMYIERRCFLKQDIYWLQGRENGERHALHLIRRMLIGMFLFSSGFQTE
jgi:hypothetical protein